MEYVYSIKVRSFFTLYKLKSIWKKKKKKRKSLFALYFAHMPGESYRS